MFRSIRLKLYESIEFYCQLKDLQISQWDIEERGTATRNRLNRQQR